MAITKKPLQPSSGLNANPPAEAAPVDGLKQDGARPGKTIEEMYQKKTQLEHILLRPDTYIGSIEKHSQQLWVYEDNQMVNRMVSYVPGLYKIFDEILVNAADNKQRDPSMDSVKVDIDVEQNTISVFNNGDGVPVEVHQEEGVYVPEMIFGHLLTSSNYDDNVKKTTGGRNGYGAKLTNIFSTEFIIQTADGKRQKKYKQVFSNNMSIKSDPSISKCKDGENWTRVTFKPDLAKFNMTHLEDDVVALMKKRVVDLAGCLGKTIKVELNGKRVPVKSFGDYVSLYLQSASKSRSDPLPRITEKVNDRWEICVSLSEGQFQQVSFVNSIATIKGGTHVEYVTSQVTNHIMNIVNKKNKNAAMKAHSVKNHLWVFVNALIDNPAFDSQTKETLTTRQGSFGSKCELSQEFLKKVAKSGVVESLLSWADFKQSKDLKKTDGSKRQRLTGITKLEDANDAGGKHSEECTLILTEGDSAKALAMAGISVVGRNHYGVFPLRGKLLNVREASHKQIMENAEIQNIKRILGLQHGKEYDSVKSLRYGHLMIMTDQDHDGSHIKGLLINFIHSFWPSLLKIPSFLVEFITPIVKATHKNGNVLSFYSMPEYETWREQVGRTTKSWSIKYYKGLGTSTSKEGKEYFSNLRRHKKEFRWVDDHDGDAIELAFSKKKIEERKTWLKQFQQGTYLDQSQNLINYKDFVNKELILFSRADLERSIPSMLDGLKPGQRKILFCCFKRNLTSDVKVAQFSGYVSEHSAYHHGEQSLASTIIGMAQNYVGSNNINLLFPAGQFGTRNQGGKDHASARYIYTRMSPLTRFLFPKDDDILLDYMEEDGLSIEPQWYMPIIPTVLVNGSEGIGTGWSSFIPNYNPRDIVDNVKRLLRGENMEPMEPWYKGFEGLIEKSSTKESGATYTVSGVIEQINETMLRITELPIRKWTQDYKEFLESMMSGNDKIKEPFIKDYREHNTDTKVHFEVFLTEENMKTALQEGLLKKFKLTSSISTSNMHLFDANCNIKRYDCPEQVLEEFVPIRLSFYEKRKRVLLDNLTEELLKLADKVRFILGVVGGEIIVSNRKRAELLDELHRKGFRKFSKQSKGSGVAAAVSNQDDAESPESPQNGGYEYLLSMPIGSLTLEKVQELCSQRDKLHNDVEELKKSTPESLWLYDLDTFLVQFDELERLEAKDEENQLNDIAGNAAKRTSRQVAKNPRKNNAKKPSSATITEQMEVEPETSTSIPKEVAKEPSKPGKRAPSKRNSKKDVESDDEDEELLELKDRLAKYNLNSSSPSDESAMDTEVVVAPPRKETSSRRVAQKPQPLYSEISDDEGNDDQLKPVAEEDGGAAAQRKQQLSRKPRGKKQAVDSTDDEEYTEADDDDSGSDFEVRAATKVATNKKGRGKAAKSTVIDNVGGNKKRGDDKTKPALGQKLINELLKPVEKTGISPDRKVRKMRPSPFNKKSGVSRSSTETSLESLSSLSKGQSPDSDEEEVAVVEVPIREKRPQRNRTVAKYVISDSDSDEA